MIDINTKTLYFGNGDVVVGSYGYTMYFQGFKPPVEVGILISDERYRNKYMKQFEDFFYKNIYGKEWNEIDGEILDSYSDWHKDMFGYRPRSTDKDW